MKKLLAGLLALMALGFVLSGCKKDDDDDEEVFTELAESDFDNAEEWLIGSWYGEMEEFDFDCSDSYAEGQGTTKDEIKTEAKKTFASQLSEADPCMLGDMEITEDNLSKYTKNFCEFIRNDEVELGTLSGKITANEGKTKFRIILEINQSSNDMWAKMKLNILYTKK